MELPDPVLEQLLDSWPVARLATLGPDGAPHQVPVVFARRGETLYSPVDGKPKRGGDLARIRNARRDPRVSLLLDEYRDDWQRLWWLRVEGEARVVEPADAERDREVLDAVAALRAKYPQYERVAVIGPEPILLAIRVRGLRSWCASLDVRPGLAD
jgi:PPOX class probable F420-dependent enzyme